MTTEGWKSISPEATKKEMPKFELWSLAIGDILITTTGQITIHSIQKQAGNAQQPLYNFILDGNNTYYANGYLVHNKTMITVCDSYDWLKNWSTCSVDPACCYNPSVPEILGTCQGSINTYSPVCNGVDAVPINGCDTAAGMQAVAGYGCCPNGMTHDNQGNNMCDACPVESWPILPELCVELPSCGNWGLCRCIIDETWKIPLSL
jgi:hypothetical protein